MGIAHSVLEAVRTEMLRYPGTYPTKVCVRIGELTAIDEESLRFCFDAMCHDTELESLKLEVEICPRRHRCVACRQEFTVRHYEFICPQCGSPETQCCGGDELELGYLEVEEYGTSTVGTKSTE
jgi:hydrogenase nickel incorporation protein HypA/HybF